MKKNLAILLLLALLAGACTNKLDYQSGPVDFMKSMLSN